MLLKEGDEVKGKLLDLTEVKLKFQLNKQQFKNMQDQQIIQLLKIFSQKL